MPVILGDHVTVEAGTQARAEVLLAEYVHLVEDLVEGSKMLFKSTRTGHRIYYFVKRRVKSAPRG